jgi:undecaprenyl-diphosphatase
LPRNRPRTRPVSALLTRLAGVARTLSHHISKRDRAELAVLVGALLLIVLTMAFVGLAGEVLEGDTLAFDQQVLRSLRRSDDPTTPRGPAWLHAAALDITALGGAPVLGLAVAAIVGYLLLQGMKRTALFVLIASAGGWGSMAS